MGIKYIYIYIHWEKAKSYLNIQYAKGNVVGSHGNVVGIEGEYDGNRVEIQGEYMSLKSNIMKCRQCRWPKNKTKNGDQHPKKGGRKERHDSSRTQPPEKESKWESASLFSVIPRLHLFRTQRSNWHGSFTTSFKCSALLGWNWQVLSAMRRWTQCKQGKKDSTDSQQIVVWSIQIHPPHQVTSSCARKDFDEFKTLQSQRPVAQRLEASRKLPASPCLLNSNSGN